MNVRTACMFCVFAIAGCAAPAERRAEPPPAEPRAAPPSSEKPLAQPPASPAPLRAKPIAYQWSNYRYYKIAEPEHVRNALGMLKEKVLKQYRNKRISNSDLENYDLVYFKR